MTGPGSGVTEVVREGHSRVRLERVASDWSTGGCSQSPDLLPPQTLPLLPLLPLNRLAPRLRRSVEGLNLELEEVFVSEKSDDQHEVRRPFSSFSGAPERGITCLPF